MRVTAFAAIVLVSACGQALAPREATSGPTLAASAPSMPAGPDVSDGAPRDARLSIPGIGMEALDVVAYEGSTDDGPGTEIQNRGLAASPHGPDGGVGPGGLGNYQVTAHRL